MVPAKIILALICVPKQFISFIVMFVDINSHQKDSSISFLRSLMVVNSNIIVMLTTLDGAANLIMFI